MHECVQRITSGVFFSHHCCRKHGVNKSKLPNVEPAMCRKVYIYIYMYLLWWIVITFNLYLYPRIERERCVRVCRYVFRILRKTKGFFDCWQFFVSSFVAPPRLAIMWAELKGADHPVCGSKKFQIIPRLHGLGASPLLVASNTFNCPPNLEWWPTLTTFWFVAYPPAIFLPNSPAETGSSLVQRFHILRRL